jgi:hypothetical protein
LKIGELEYDKKFVTIKNKAITIENFNFFLMRNIAYNKKKILNVSCPALPASVNMLIVKIIISKR